jgi:GTP cyclohydrolase I
MSEQGIHALLRELGEDPEREGLRETPARVMKAWKFWCSGYDVDPGSVLKTFEDGGEGYDDAMVFQGNIPYYSTCCHHLVPFFGAAHIAYIPNGRVVGLSKLARLLEVFARRLQTQERITVQVADALMEHLSPIGCAVTLQARHLCIESRGVQKIGTITTTTALRGEFKEKPEVRAEFMSLVMAQAKADNL